jgi:hypothetical protein
MSLSSEQVELYEAKALLKQKSEQLHLSLAQFKSNGQGVN